VGRTFATVENSEPCAPHCAASCSGDTDEESEAGNAHLGHAASGNNVTLNAIRSGSLGRELRGCFGAQ
jgi:hypothetical protein